MVEIKDWYGKEPLTMVIATDHGGFEMKKVLVAALTGKGIKITDIGPFTLDPQDDYPDFAGDAARAVSLGKADCGLLICRSGVGMGINANRFHNVRAVIAG